MRTECLVLNKPSHRIAVFTPAGQVSWEALSGVLKVFGRRSDVEIFSNVWFGHAPVHRLADFDGHGCVVLGSTDTHTQGEIAELRIPTVYTHAEPTVPDAYVVRDDDHAIGQRAAEHLLSLGLRHLAFCGTTVGEFNRRRAEGFALAARDAGASCTAYFGAPMRFRDEASFKAGQDELIEWLRQLPQPIGVMASFDLRAMEVLRACQLAGIRVPEEVAVIGVDNRTELCEAVWPSLSSITRNDYQRGMIAAQMLLDLIRHESLPSRLALVKPGALVQRLSTTMLATADPLVVQFVRIAQRQLAAGVSVEQILDMLNVSRRALEKRTQAALGRTPAEQVRRLRVERAKQLLVESNDSMSDIAFACGYRNQNRFAQAFRLATGESPTGWRRRMQFATTSDTRSVKRG
jgi:LacI family transcriptional regulator